MIIFNEDIAHLFCTKHVSKHHQEFIVKKRKSQEGLDPDKTDDRDEWSKGT